LRPERQGELTPSSRPQNDVEPALPILYNPHPVADHVSSDVKLEIGHVLFIDIVGYSKLLITDQSERLQKLIGDATQALSDCAGASAWRCQTDMPQSNLCAGCLGG